MPSRPSIADWLRPGLRRLFRLPEDGALINRMGFNNDGADAVAERIARVRRAGPLGVPVGDLPLAIVLSWM